MPPLQLTLSEYTDDAHWLWRLTDERDNYLADHPVALDVAAPQYRAFVDLPKYLTDYATPDYTVRNILAEIGAWAGAQVFGGLLPTLRARRQSPAQSPATVIRVTLPPEAHALLSRPFELAHLDGKPLVEWGIRFVYQSAPTPQTARGAQAVPGPSPVAKTATGEGGLRVLAIFSLPDDQHPLNLRRERYRLERLLEQIAQTHGVAIETRVIQYGATRETLKDALEEAPGWDVIHFSGHGLEGELALETGDGQLDEITTADLKDLLQLAKARVKLIALSACLSGATTVAAAKAQLGLGDAPAPDVTPAATTLPSLAQALADELDCATVAMRYSVEADFAEHLLLALYERLLAKHQPLPGALQLALDDALKANGLSAPPALSSVTPLLFGARAADLTLIAPPRRIDFEAPTIGLFNFPPEPERFVGRLQPMLRASHALAPESAQRGVLLYGMAGAGKTTCAVELAYRHERDRFTGYVWHKAPNEGDDITAALLNFMVDLETQLDMQDQAFTAHVDDPVAFERRTLPRLKQLLATNAVLIVIDNLESLLTAADQWRDPKWGKLIEALLAHDGASRVILTSRRQPASLKDHARLTCEAIHALSFGESVLLARELPHLQSLFATDEGRQLLTRLLRIAQGHPKLIELADHLAADPAALSERLAQAEADASGTPLADFFEKGKTKQGEASFSATLKNWTMGLVAQLSLTARLLFTLLCRLEDEDRISSIIEIIWPNFLTRIVTTQASFPHALGGNPEADQRDSPMVSLDARQKHSGMTAEQLPRIKQAPIDNLETALAQLVASGLIEARSLSNQQSEIGNQQSFRLHPFVAESGLQGADLAILSAADIELGDYWGSVWQHGMDTEMQGGGPLIVEGGKRAAPYLMRAARWKEAAMLLERVIQRDRIPATLAFALPLLRRIAEATKDSDLGLGVAGVLANALLEAGRYAEAEQMQRALIAQCLERHDYRSASGIASYLLNLLMARGRFEEALPLAAQIADYTRRAGLGPWTQLLDEGMRLQILNALGRYPEVLDAVQRLRGQLTTLPETGEAEETVNVWNVRETLLDTGRQAAQQLQQWETALSLNAEIVQFLQQRGADAVELAGKRFNDYGPLLRLNRYADARALLEYCRAVDEQAHDIVGLGKDFSALADLEDEVGNRAAAIRFERVALRYRYQAGQPEDCAISHNNLAEYLECFQSAPEAVLAQRLAAGIIRVQISSGMLPSTINNLANASLPAMPPTFDEVVARVEQIEGVRFRELFARLPQRMPDGDAAIAAVWQLVKERQEAKRQAQETRSNVLAAMPADIRAAFDANDVEALNAAFSALPPEEAARIVQQLRDAGLIGGSAQPDPQAVLAAMPADIRAAFELDGEEFSQAMKAALSALPPEEAAHIVQQLRDAGLIG